jgi:hypothetical protein
MIVKSDCQGIFVCFGRIVAHCGQLGRRDSISAAVRKIAAGPFYNRPVDDHLSIFE